MAVFECTSRVTRRSLMNKTKDALATRVLELHAEIGRVRELLDRERAKRASDAADLEVVWTELSEATARNDAIIAENDRLLRRADEVLSYVVSQTEVDEAADLGPPGIRSTLTAVRLPT